MFSDHEIRKFLDAKACEMYFRLVQSEQIRQALPSTSSLDSVGGYETCPFCPFGMLIEASFEENKIFECKNPDCGIESCRKCQKETHLPKSCEENAKDDVTNLQHQVEEAMTQALVRYGHY
jgi:TRIAD3 protein (E3 ubiquitin-protein ligase RNF216)